ncbi:MAG TPA: biotin--[acetyl-CoA-carboxylase] ligase [Cyanobacteria bacterium UBA8530]|nr:biotin--[acetyl-CoA-carboxylase] ligase [Cyanobacteria bacterium UBA8530]
MSENRLCQNFLFIEEVDSTNRVLKEMALAGSPMGTVLAAERQSGGYGSKGRTWISEKGGAFFSCLLPWNEHFTLFPLVVGVACARALRTFSPEVFLKWPNDLVLRGRKLGGILVESRHGLWAIAGIGINIFPCSLPEAASLSEIEKSGKIATQDLISLVLFELEAAWEDLLDEKTEEILAAWSALSLTIGQEVVLQSNGSSHSGRALSLDPLGGLVISREGSVEVFYEGTLRRPDGGYA